MCGGCCGCEEMGPYGIPVERDTFDKLPEDVKKAWTVFDEWWDKVYRSFEVKCVDEKSMPKEVKEAWELMKKTVIPGYEVEGITLKDSCYMSGVQMYFDAYPQSDINPD